MSTPSRASGLARIVLTLTVVLCLGLLVIGAKKTKVPENLGEQYKAWLESVDSIITKEERDAFLAIEKDYQRDAFI